MFIARHIFVVILCLIFHFSAYADEKQSIVGGGEALRGEFPFIVSLQDTDGHFCGGSLIKSNWVLTAAHCTLDGAPTVVIGLHDQDDKKDAETFQAVKIIRHPKYDTSPNDYDFSLIQLDKKSKFTPIALNSEDFREQNINFTVAGWGLMNERDSRLPKILQKVTVPFVSQKTCENAYPDQITDRMICAGFEEGNKDSCQGDSGGPMIVDTKNGKLLVGVVSWGEGCARPHKFGIYAKVSSVIDWIHETTN